MADAEIEALTDQIFGKMMTLADQGEDYPALTKTQWHDIKNQEERTEKAHENKAIRDYLRATRQE